MTLKIYRGEGGGAPSSGRTVTAYGTHYATDKRLATRFGRVSEYVLSSQANIFDYSELRNEISKVRAGDSTGNRLVESYEDILEVSDPEMLTERLQSLGYDGLVNDNVGGTEYVIWNEDVVHRAAK
jgi:hypothetical protein